MKGPKGFKAAGIASGLKPEAGARDLALIYSEVPANVAGVFTRNRVKAAPVIYTRKMIRRGECRAILVNSGNANACTGKRGLLDAGKTAEEAAKELHIPKSYILVSSTGVIGVPLPVNIINKGIPELVSSLSEDGFLNAAESIMTTDTFPKLVSETVSIENIPVNITGMAKGAGMIHPQLATMLGFIVTDATIEKPMLSRLLNENVQSTFNCITVDGDTSTNDMVLLMANGKSGCKPVSPNNSDFSRFNIALNNVMGQLAKSIIIDGEGRTKVVEICVQGARNTKDAREIGLKVANSPLVKTAFFGEDPNWGRIMAAVGNAGVPFKPEKVNIFFDNVPVVNGGTGVNETTEEMIKKVLEKEEFKIIIDLDLGNASASVLTTDFSYDYVKINASYRT